MGKKAKNGSSGRVAELERPLGERDRVIGGLTAANRGDLPAGRAFPPCALFATGRGKKWAGMLEGAACGPSKELLTLAAASAGHRTVPTVTAKSAPTRSRPVQGSQPGLPIQKPRPKGGRRATWRAPPVLPTPFGLGIKR